MSEVIDQDQQGVQATPETLAKLKPDPLRLLYTRGGQGKGNKGLDPDPYANLIMYDAGWEIDRAFRLITQPVAAKGADYAREVRGGDWERRELTLLKNEALVRRYNNWVDALKEHGVPYGPIIDVVVYDLSCKEVDRGRRKRDGWTVKVLRSGLRLYAQVAGWTRRAA